MISRHGIRRFKQAESIRRLALAELIKNVCELDMDAIGAPVESKPS